MERRARSSPQHETTPKPAREPGPHQVQPDHAAILALQRTAGNGAVSQLLASSPVVQRRYGGAVPDRKAPEKTTIDVTGFYEAADSGAQNRITLQLNQAGRHIEGWWQRHAGYGFGNQEDLFQHRITGDLAVDHLGAVGFTYQRINSAGKLAADGLLTATRDEEGVDLQLHEDSSDQRFTQSSGAARLSDEAIAAMPGDVRPVVKASQQVPLDKTEEAVIYAAAEEICREVENYYSESRGVARSARASALNLIVREKMGVFRPEQKPMAIRSLRYYLTNVDVKSGSVTRPVWDWLEVIAAVDHAWTPALHQFLDLKPSGINDPQAPQHKYRWTMQVLGAAADLLAEVSGYIGQLTVHKLGPDTWSADYFTILGGMSAGVQAGIKVKLPLKAARGQLSTPNDFESPFPWTSGNFAGGYSMLQGSARAGLGVGASYSKGFILFSGDGTYPALQAPADSWSLEIVAGAGAGVGGTGGWMWGGKDDAVREAKQQQALEAHSAPHSVIENHFAVDDPSLTASGRQAIRVICALHRAELENPSSTITVDGYASPTGSHARNQQLSQLRARNVLQAIRDVMGKAIRIPPGSLQAEGHGDGPALRAGIPQGTETAAWRRVDVAINGQVVLTLD